MTRRGKPKQVNWYLREWMEACGLDRRGGQAELAREAGWSKATMSQLYNADQDYSPEILNAAARVFKAQPWELLMLPEQAMQIRRVFKELSEVAAKANLAPSLVSDMTERRTAKRISGEQRTDSAEGKKTG